MTDYWISTPIKYSYRYANIQENGAIQEILTK